MSNLEAHARREMERIGEGAVTVEWMCRVVREFASFGHSGGSAAVLVPALNTLLRYRPLSPLTADPAEWRDVSTEFGCPCWQNIRDSRAMSHDGGVTYWMVDDDRPADLPAPVYRSEPPIDRGPR